MSAARDYATDAPIPGVREFDEAASYRIVRVPLLRASDRPAMRRAPSGLQRLWDQVTRLLIDVPILSRTLVVTGWLSLIGRIPVICIGDLISLGWMAWPLRRVLRRKVIFYIHGEEVSVHDASFFLRLRKRVLAEADAIVAVSSFTRDLLVSRMGVPKDKIAVIANAVDETHFHPG
ncbi:MAG: glycosyltransferase family 4 protein, partial [Terriglobia bacterium]